MRFISLAATIAQVVSRGLYRLSSETGGLTFPNPGHKISEVFSQIESDLRNTYVLGFVPPNDARDRKFHKLDVLMLRPDLIVRARTGYWASRHETDYH
jgi:VWFA-related protein